MNWKTPLLATAAAAALCGASSAFAHPPAWAPAYGWHGEPHRHHFHRPRQVLIAPPPPVYYAPPPPVIIPAPAVVYPSAYPRPGWHVSIGLRL